MPPQTRTRPSPAKKQKIDPVAPPLTEAHIVKALDSLSRQAFISLLSSAVLPAINALPPAQLNDVHNLFKKAQPSFQARYETRCRELGDSLAGRDEKGHHLEESEHASQTLIVIDKWLKEIFPVSIEQKQELLVAHKSLVDIESAFKDLADTVPDFEDMPMEMYIYRSDITPPALAYQTEFSKLGVVLKMWRDLLLVALAQGEEDVVREIVKWLKTRIRNRECLREFLDYVRGEETPDTAVITVDGREYDDGWHSDEMKAALPALRELFADVVLPEPVLW